MRLLKTLFTFAAIAGLALAGCDNDGTAGRGNGDRPVIGVSIPSADHGWTGGVVYWANEARRQFGDEVEIRVQTSGSATEQVNQIENMITQGVDAMVVLAHDPAPVTPVARSISQRGIYLVSVDRGFTEPVADVYVVGDNHEYGRRSAQVVAERLGGEGNVVMITGLENPVNSIRVQAAQEVFAQYPGIRVLDVVPGDWSRERAMNQMQILLQKHDRIDAVLTQDDDMAEGAEQAIREARREDEMWIMGGAGKKEIVARMMEGDAMYPANLTYPPGMIYAGIAIAKAHLVDGNMTAAADDIPDHLGVTGEMLEEASEQEGQKQVTLPVLLITPENAEQFYFPESVF